MSIEAPILHRILRSMTEPARRHKCAICSEIFECHLCLLEDDHNLHTNKGAITLTRRFICEPCIVKHELYIVMTISGHEPKSGKRKYESQRLSKERTFYDHLTGERLGRGTIRRN